MAAPGLSCGLQTLSCGTGGFNSLPGIEPGSSALGAQRLSHWTTGEVSLSSFIFDGLVLTARKGSLEVPALPHTHPMLGGFGKAHQSPCCPEVVLRLEGVSRGH